MIRKCTLRECIIFYLLEKNVYFSQTKNGNEVIKLAEKYSTRRRSPTQVPLQINGAVQICVNVAWQEPSIAQTLVQDPFASVRRMFAC